MRKKILLLTLLSSYASNASAVNLQEALISGYNHSEDFQFIRTDFMTTIEEFPKALADFMPRVSANLKSTGTKSISKSSVANFNNSNYNRSLTIQQSLFSGGSSVAGLKAAQAFFMAARSNYYNQEQKIFIDEIQTYLNCVAQKEKYDIAKTAVNSNKKQLEAVKEQFKFGESTETEVASAESALASAEANESSSYANYESAKAEFFRIFSMEAVDLSIPALPEDLPETLDKLTEIALNAHPIIDQARHATRGTKSQEYAVKGTLLPQVSLNITNDNSIYTPQIQGTSLNNNRSYTSTISVNVPILSRGGAEYSDVRKAKQQTRKSALQLDAQIKQVKSQCRAGFEGLQAAKNKIQATSEAVRSAQVGYDGTVQEEKLGSKTLLDILNMQDRLNKAKSDNVDANKDLVLAAYQVKSLTGTLTAKSMKLPVQYFEPEQEFKKVKMKIIGF